MKSISMTLYVLVLMMLATPTYAQDSEATAGDAEMVTQPVVTETDGVENELPPIKVMSFNVRWGGAADPPSVWSKRRERVLETIQAYDPDILGVQESILRQSKYLRDNLEGYIFYGAGRDNGVLAGEMCAVYYRSNRFRRVGGGHFWLSEEPQVPGSYGWDAGCPRIVTWLRLRDKHDGRTLVVTNTHMDHRGKKARLNGAILLREKMMEIAEGEPVIIMGDFNCHEDSDPYAELLGLNDEAGAWLIDSYRAVHPERTDQEATYHGFRGGTEGSRIDWVLHTPHFQALTATIDTTHEGLKYPSDHFPVTATLLRIDEAAPQPVE